MKTNLGTSLLKIYLALLLPLPAMARTIVVSPGTMTATLKRGVEMANNGDTILVRKGTYTSFNTLINKELTVLGENEPVLDARFHEEVVTITSGHVKFDGFIIKNSKTGSMRDYAGIRLSSVEDVIISNNKLINNFFGIYLSDCKRIQVLHNTLIGSDNVENSGNGIHLWKCREILIKGNHVTRHRDGIYFEFAKKSLIEDNLSENNIRYGLHFMFSDDDTYRHNTFKNNGSGVSVMFSHGVNMQGNTFERNQGGSAYGILMKEITDSRAEANHFSYNTCGIYMEGTTRIMVTGNTFDGNGWAMKIQASCSDNTITRNNFKGNTFDVATNGSLVLSRFSNNYWDKYDGYDLKKDGLGDIPYRPVSLYSMIMERNPVAMILFRSLIAGLMDKSEKMIPSLTPENLKDPHPLMKALDL